MTDCLVSILHPKASDKDISKGIWASDIDSLHCFHYTSGLEQQAQLQMRVAQSKCQRLKWQQPTVVFHFPQGVHQDVKLALQVRYS